MKSNGAAESNVLMLERVGFKSQLDGRYQLHSHILIQVSQAQFESMSGADLKVLVAKQLFSGLEQMAADHRRILAEME